MEQEMALIRRLQAGDQDAFAKLLETYEKSVYNLCLRMTGNREDAADLTQEAFLKVWRGAAHRVRHRMFRVAPANRSFD